MTTTANLMEAAGYLVVAFSLFVFLLCGIGTLCDRHIDEGDER